MRDYKIFAINPGSTSTKIALFQGVKCLFSANVSHEASVLKEFKEMVEQLSYRKETIDLILSENKISLQDVDAYVGRGGGLLSVEGGTYEVNDIMIAHAKKGANGVNHPAQLGSLLAMSYAEKYKKPTYVVNPPDTDELIDVARMTGIKGVYRNVHLHALNLKETAIRHSEKMGKKYEECNYVVCHLGGGVSVSAHQLGKMIDGNDIIGGDGPMAPTRCGSVSVIEIVKLINEGELPENIKAFAMKNGGFVSHLGTNDVSEIEKKILEGNKTAQLVWSAFIYQIEKYIGAMGAALAGKVDGILLSGGIVHSNKLVEKLTEDCSWLAPVYAYPGEFEMEAMASGVLRVLTGAEISKTYTGIPIWNGFDL